MNTVARWILLVLGLAGFGGALLLTMRDATPPSEVRVVADYQAWQPETLEIAETIPVQDGGRVKPLATYANFTMLRLFGARSMKIRASEDAKPVTVKPLAWMMDVLFRPRFAIHEPSFRIDDSDALKAIGVPTRGKRDRYSYAEIEGGRDRLYELAEQYRQLDKKARSAQHNQILTLAENMHSYEQLLGVFALARNGVEMIPVPGTEGADQAQDLPKRADVSAIMQTAQVIRTVLMDAEKEGKPIPPHVENLLRQVIDGADASRQGMFLFPPAEKADEHWLSPGERVLNAVSLKTTDMAGSVKDVKEIETLSRAALGEEAGFRKLLKDFRADIVKRASERGEYGGVVAEANYYRKNLLLYSMIWFLLAVPVVIAMWMSRGKLSKILGWGVWGLTGLGWGYVVTAIVKRSILMQRPPIGNLYDTIIFIAAAVIAFGAILEWLTRRRLALGVLPIAGLMLILLARLFEVGEATDHMNPLIAVLRSNYWLTLHVITITLGYSSGFVCAAMGMVYVLMRGLRLDRGDTATRRSLTRSVYGMVCLTLFLSLVGTVLGGIWANDSWGRFWGWDPKENGALMIVVTTLAILHARLGGFIREWGLHLSAIFLAAVVTFSWWHVNMLDTGLHNYGFTEGADIIKLVYGVIGLILLFGFIARAMELAEASPATSGPTRLEEQAAEHPG